MERFLLAVAMVVGTLACGASHATNFAEFEGTFLAFHGAYLYFQDSQHVVRSYLYTPAPPLFAEGVCKDAEVVAELSEPIVASQLTIAADDRSVFATGGASGSMSVVRVLVQAPSVQYAVSPPKTIVGGLGTAWYVDNTDLVAVDAVTGDQRRTSLAATNLGARKSMVGNDHGVGVLFEKGLVMSSGEVYPIADYNVEAVTWNQAVVMFRYTDRNVKTWYYCQGQQAGKCGVHDRSLAVASARSLAQADDGEVQVFEDEFIFTGPTGGLLHAWIENATGNSRAARYDGGDGGFEHFFFDGTYVYFVLGQTVQRATMMRRG